MSQMARRETKQVTSEIETHKVEQQLTELVYYTDPLCCWSFAMQQQWISITKNPFVRYRYCMGGLLPSWDQYHDPVNAVSRPIQMGPVWMQATHLTGVQLKNTIWIKDPPSSSYLACMAFKAAQFQDFNLAENFLFRLQVAVMQEGINISKLDNVLTLASECSLDTAVIEKSLHDDTAITAFREDLNEVTLKRIERFPSFLVRRQGQPLRLISGYQERLEELVLKDKDSHLR